MAEPTAVEATRREIQALELRLDNLKKALELLSADAKEEEFGVTILPDEFSGMEKAAAVERYLRKLNPPRPANLLEEVLPALIKGGCQLGPKKDQNGDDRRPRNLQTTVTMNAKKPHHPFVFSESDGTVRLRHPQAKVLEKNA